MNCCDHPKIDHTIDGRGNGMCTTCPDDSAQSWRHDYCQTDGDCG